MTRLKFAAAGVLAAMTLATAGVVAVGARRPDEPGPAMKAPGRREGGIGRREENGGRPADPAPGRPGTAQGTGHIRPGIEGRIVDLEGRPVADARIDVPYLWWPRVVSPAGSRSSRRPRARLSAAGSTRPVNAASTAPRRASCGRRGPRSRPPHRPRRPLPPGRRRSGPDRRDPRLQADDRHGPALRHGLRRRRRSARHPPVPADPARSSSTPGGSSTPSRRASRSRASSATRTPAGPSPV